MRSLQGKNRPSRYGQLLPLIWLAVAACAVLVRPAWAGLQPDVRILIDVSGSMKETDPQNLRIPATKLLINLLPENARAGVWTFGTEAAVLVPLRTVNDDWRERAMAQTSQIASRARYTDVADGLLQVDANWQGAPGAGPRLVILLTDGQVDVDDDSRLDAQSRSEILEKMVPGLRDRQVQLYAVGLSEGADQRMLEEMSIMTGGFSVVARNADELLAAFLDIFSAALPVNAVPVERQLFSVDDSIRELTVLAMHPYRQEPVALRTPSGQIWKAEEHGSGVHWLTQDTFSMVHVAQPEVGTWGLLGGGLDTRVHIHSDLKIGMSGLNPHVLAGEEFRVHAWLEDKDGPVTNPAILDILRYSMHVLPPSGSPQSLQHDTAESHGVLATFVAPDEPGLYRVAAYATAGILRRTAAQLVRVYEDAYEVAQRQVSDPQGGVRQRFELQVRREIVREQGLRVSAQLRLPDGHASSPKVRFDAGAGTWFVEVPVQPGVHEFRFRLDGYNANGRAFRTQTPALLFGDPGPEPVIGSEEGTGLAPPADAAATAEPDSSTRWWLQLLGAMLVVAAGGLLAILLWAKHRARQNAAASAAPPADEEAVVALDQEELPSVVAMTQASLSDGPPAPPRKPDGKGD